MSSQATILIVDDEPSICWGFETLLRQHGHEVLIASSAEAGWELAASHAIDLVVLDVRLPGADGISAMPEFIRRTSGAPVIVMTAFGDLQTAVSAVRDGATDYLTKPFQLEDAWAACERALNQGQRSANTQALASGIASQPQGQLVGSSDAMQAVFKQIALVASSDLSVLITGETGTGKELVAAAIHQHSGRSESRYLPIAPVAFNQDLIESELFGHVKGAFTGAETDRAGLFEQARGGTVLLDEIADLSLSTQIKLLRVLENQQFTRVGELEIRETDVRILAATNCNLRELIDQGKFREDLYYRLAGMQIHLPPLRERREDLPALCEYFLQLLGYANAQTAIDDSLFEQLAQRRWLGNIRELKNAVGHAAVLARGRALSIDDFPDPIEAASANASNFENSLERAAGQWAAQEIATGCEDMTDLHIRFLSVAEPELIKAALGATGGNRARAAELLGIHRGTLRDRMRLYGLE